MAKEIAEKGSKTIIYFLFKDSCIPGGVFVWTVENMSSEPKSVSITCTLKNGTGDKADRQGDKTHCYANLNNYDMPFNLQ